VPFVRSPDGNFVVRISAIVALPMMSGLKKMAAPTARL
jgi:hypothetical protein